MIAPIRSGNTCGRRSWGRWRLYRQLQHGKVKLISVPKHHALFIVDAHLEPKSNENDDAQIIWSQLCTACITAASLISWKCSVLQQPLDAKSAWHPTDLASAIVGASTLQRNYMSSPMVLHFQPTKRRFSVRIMLQMPKNSMQMAELLCKNLQRHPRKVSHCQMSIELTAASSPHVKDE